MLSDLHHFTYGSSTEMATNGTPSTSDFTVDVDNLTFDLGGPNILSNITLKLPAGSRCLLIGANGAGKSTLLRILAGKRLIKHGSVEILGKRAFFENIPVR